MSENWGAERNDTIGADGRGRVGHDDVLEARERSADLRDQRADERDERADQRDQRADEREREIARREAAHHFVAEVDQPSGTVVGDRWRLDEPIAAGSGGTVWRGTDLRLGREIAVKVMRSGFVDDRVAIDRFRREAQLLAMVDHEHVMALYDFEVHDERLFLISEYVGGMSLRELINEHAPFPPEVVAAVGVQLGEGIAAIHARGVLHRDLKPRNVVLTDRGSLKIVDFGTARHLTAERTPLTEGVVAGSPAYLAPEQVEGRFGDQRTDLYALGLILWEAATGRRPFTGDTDTATALARLTAEVPDLVDIGATDDAALSQVVAGLTCRDPRRRTRTAWEAVDALRPMTAARPVDLVAALQKA